MANPFKSVQCAIRYDNARIISWTMESGYNYPANFILQVENSRVGGPWTNISGSITNSCTYVDTRRRNYGKEMNESYRVRLKVTGTSEEYVSEAVDAGTQSAWPFSSEAKNVTAQVEKAIMQSGVTGVLLKRKTWGDRCTKCTDFDGQMSVNEHCPECFGTGISGGYFNGISLDIVKDAIKCKEGVNRLGYGQIQTVSARCIAYPFITEGDVWVEDGTNARYRIVDAEEAASYKSTTLVYKLEMNKIEYTDALYTKPIDDKVALKDVWESSAVDYTPAYVQEKEQQSKSDWETEMESM